MNKESKIYLAGHSGMVGGAILRKLQSEGFRNIVIKSSAELDLRNQSAVENFFAKERPEYVFLAAAKVGEILANNNYRAEFMYDNIMIDSNLINYSYLYNVKKLLFLGSSSIYPKMAPQPLKEEYLLSGYLDETHKSNAIAKIAGVKMCESYREEYGCDFISAIPTNLYGANDNYDLENGHVLAALLRKFIEAQKNNISKVTIRGSGNPRREFLHVDDMADACLFLMYQYSEKDIINIGTGTDITIFELAQIIQRITGFRGEIMFDQTKPDGVPRKLLDVTKINGYGWKSQISLEDGIKRIYNEIKNKF